MLCRKEETVTVYPADVVLFEGILAFYSQEVRDLFQMKLFVDTDADTRLSRRGAFCKLQMARLGATLGTDRWEPVRGMCTPEFESWTVPYAAVCHCGQASCVLAQPHDILPPSV